MHTVQQVVDSVLRVGEEDIAAALLVLLHGDFLKRNPGWLKPGMRARVDAYRGRERR